VIRSAVEGGREGEKRHKSLRDRWGANVRTRGICRREVKGVVERADWGADEFGDQRREGKLGKGMGKARGILCGKRSLSVSTSHCEGEGFMTAQPGKRKITACLRLKLD